MLTLRKCSFLLNLAEIQQEFRKDLAKIRKKSLFGQNEPQRASNEFGGSHIQSGDSFGFVLHVLSRTLCILGPEPYFFDFQNIYLLMP